MRERVTVPGATTTSAATAVRSAVTLPGALVAYAVLVAVCLHLDGSGPRFALAGVGLAMWVGLLVVLARSSWSRMRAAVFVVVSGAVLQVVALTAGPRTSDDVYRYIWDGRVQFAGIDPYRYTPSSPQLAQLRDGLLFGHCGHHFPGGCTLINRPLVHTVYPPVSQWAFDVVHLLSFGGHGGVRPFQVAGAVGVVALAALLARRAVRRDEPVWPVAVWAWCPLVISEFANNGHIDWLSCLLVFAALTLSAAGHVKGAGLALGAAVLTKIYPGLLLPALLRRRPVVLIATAVGLGVVSYLPHVLAVGGAVIGYLPGYLQEEGYNSGARLLLLGAVLPHPLDTVVGVVIVLVLAVVCARRTDPDAPERAAVHFVGGAFLVATPQFGWYSAVLVVLIAMTRRVEWVPVAMASTFVYLATIFEHSPLWVYRVIYLGAALATLALWWGGRTILRRSSGPSPHDALDFPGPRTSTR